MGVPLITDEYVLFFGDILSNFAKAEFTMDGFHFTSSEQAYMFYKACYFNDDQAAISIMQAEHPAECKRIGRRVKGFDYSRWMLVCNDVMKTVCYEKFKQNPDLRDILVATGHRMLAEAAPKDFYWSIGMSKDNTQALNEDLWVGQNNLGKILMEVRDELR